MKCCLIVSKNTLVQDLCSMIQDKAVVTTLSVLLKVTSPWSYGLAKVLNNFLTNYFLKELFLKFFYYLKKDRSVLLVWFELFSHAVVKGERSGAQRIITGTRNLKTKPFTTQ